MDRGTAENRMPILRKARLTGEKESQACLWFPDCEMCVRKCACVSEYAAHLSTGRHCSSFETDGIT